jgi:hypothetical protein
MPVNIYIVRLVLCGQIDPQQSYFQGIEFYVQGRRASVDPKRSVDSCRTENCPGRIFSLYDRRVASSCDFSFIETAVDGIDGLMRSGPLLIIVLLSQQCKYEEKLLLFADEAVQNNLMRVNDKERQY